MATEICAFLLLAFLVAPLPVVVTFALVVGVGALLSKSSSTSAAAGSRAFHRGRGRRRLWCGRWSRGGERGARPRGVGGRSRGDRRRSHHPRTPVRPSSPRRRWPPVQRRGRGRGWGRSFAAGAGAVAVGSARAAGAEDARVTGAVQERDLETGERERQQAERPRPRGPRACGNVGACQNGSGRSEVTCSGWQRRWRGVSGRRRWRRRIARGCGHQRGVGTVEIQLDARLGAGSRARRPVDERRRGRPGRGGAPRFAMVMTGGRSMTTVSETAGGCARVRGGTPSLVLRSESHRASSV